MLARERFQTETPNVIDPGEESPPLPSRCRNDWGQGNGSRNKVSGSSGAEGNGSIYTRNGNKGAISKGIKIRCVPNEDIEDSDDDVIVFERIGSSDSSFSSSDDAETKEEPFEDEGNPSRGKKHSKKTKKNRRSRKNHLDRRLSLNEDDEDENGIAQARLFAAAMLNESEKRQRNMRGLMISTDYYDRSSMSSQRGSSHTPQDPQSKLRQMMQRASSISSIGTSDGNALNRTASLRSLGARQSSARNILDEKHLDNIWLVDDTHGVILKGGEEPSMTSFVRNRLIWRIVALLVGIILLIAFSVAMASSRSSGGTTAITGDSSAALAIASDARLAEIVDFLSDADISAPGDLYMSSSPQFRAAQWMAEEDFEKLPVPKPDALVSFEKGWTSTIPSSPSSGLRAEEATAPFNFVQRYVLAVFYFAVGGNDWGETYHFASTDRHECSWYKPVDKEAEFGPGVDDDGSKSNRDNIFNNYDAKYDAMGVMCDRDLQVREILLPANNLRGSIPSEIKHLSSLQMIHLGGNSLTGTIPENIRYLSHLTELDLSHNDLTGQMSPYYWLGERLTKLEYLDLSDNRLELLPFFEELGSSGDHNHSNRRQPIGGETSLVKLSLGGNRYTSKMRNGQQEEEEEDSSNGRSNMILLPSEFRYLTNLRELSLANMGLGGKLPSWLFHELPELRVLDLSQNLLTGTIGENMNQNNLFGESKNQDQHQNPSWALSTTSLPLQHLNALVLHDNPLTGTLPEFIGLLPALTTLSLHHTNITVGTDAANFICWRDESVLESLTTDCGDITCPCCIENCCDGVDCYKDVDWDNIGGDGWNTNEQGDHN